MVRLALSTEGPSTESSAGHTLSEGQTHLTGHIPGSDQGSAHNQAAKILSVHSETSDARTQPSDSGSAKDRVSEVTDGSSQNQVVLDCAGL